MTSTAIESLATLEADDAGSGTRWCQHCEGRSEAGATICEWCDRFFDEHQALQILRAHEQARSSFIWGLVSLFLCPLLGPYALSLAISAKRTLKKYGQPPSNDAGSGLVVAGVSTAGIAVLALFVAVTVARFVVMELVSFIASIIA